MTSGLWFVMGAYFMVCAIGYAPPDPNKPGRLVFSLAASLAAFAMATWGQG